MLAPFEIHQPATAADASALRARYAEQATLYAGGTELVLAMKEGLVSYDHLIDIKTIPALHEVRFDSGRRRLVIGSAVTHGEIERSEIVRERLPLLIEMERGLANVRVRSVGTLGGNLCFGEPHSDPPTLLLAYDGEVVLSSPTGERRIPLAEFMVGPYETALGPEEILTGVEVPEPSRPSIGAYAKFGLHERPTVGVAAVLTVDDKRARVAHARVAVGCVGPVATRLEDLERDLHGVPLTALVSSFPAAKAAGQSLDAVTDLHGSAEYKRHLASVFVSRALAAAAARAMAGAA